VLLQRSWTREKIWVTMTGLAKIATQTGKQIGLAGLVRLPGLAQIAARIDRRVRLAGLTSLAWLATQSRKEEVLVVLLIRKAGLQKIQLTWKTGLRKIQLTRKARLWRIRQTWKAKLWRIRLTWKTELCKAWGARNQKKENVLLQAKGQLHDDAQGVLRRHRNIDYKRCVK
jgi:hypothetical protein